MIHYSIIDLSLSFFLPADPLAKFQDEALGLTVIMV
jgi:hypothetical protein